MPLLLPLRLDFPTSINRHIPIRAFSYHTQSVRRADTTSGWRTDHQRPHLRPTHHSHHTQTHYQSHWTLHGSRPPRRRPLPQQRSQPPALVRRPTHVPGPQIIHAPDLGSRTPSPPTTSRLQDPIYPKVQTRRRLGRRVKGLHLIGVFNLPPRLARHQHQDLLLRVAPCAEVQTRLKE